MSNLVRVQENAAVAEATSHFEDILRCTEAKLEKGILRNVPVNGGISANGLDYTPALKKAWESKVYENATVFLNHREKSSDRDVQEKFGWLDNIRYVEGKGLFGDLHYNPQHQFARAFEWWAENKKEEIGLSHDAMIVPGKDGRVVETIAKVLSVDVVHKPATVKGIQEGVIDDKIKSRRLYDVVEASNSLIYRIIYPMNDADAKKSEADKIAAIDEIVKDLRKELKLLSGTNTKEEEMDFSKLTLDELKAKRSDLVSLAVKEHIDAEKVVTEKCNSMLKEVHESLRTPELVARVTEAVRIGQESIVKSLIDALKTVKVTESKSETPTSTGVIPARKQEEAKPQTYEETLALIK